MSYEGYKQGKHKSKGGLIRSFVKLKDNTIEDISFSGDFFLFPESSIELVMGSLKGTVATYDSVLHTVRVVYDFEGITAPGTAPEDFAISIMKAIES